MTSYFKISTRLAGLIFLLIFLSSCRNENSPVYYESDGIRETGTFFSIQLTRPSEGENWKPNSTNIIRWQTASKIDSVDILLYRKNEFKFVIAAAYPNSNRFVWTVPGDIQPSHHYRILIQKRGNPGVSAFSDYFYILN